SGGGDVAAFVVEILPRLDPFERGVDDLQVYTELFGDQVKQRDVETDDLSALFEFERRVRQGGADGQLAGLHQADLGVLLGGTAIVLTRTSRDSGGETEREPGRGERPTTP